MAELYQVATGSKKISNLARIDGISGSAVIPVVMSGGGSGYPITNGTTHQISYEDFRESVIENNANLFTQAQTIQLGSGNSQQLNTLAGFEFTMITGSGIGSVTTVAEGLKLEIFGQGTNAGVKFFAFDNTDATPANRFKTFIEVGTGNSNLNLTRNVLATGNLNVAGNLGVGGNLNINQNLVVGGTITAQSYNSELISSSIIYESGSTKFGDTTDDTHQRTGSLLVSGSSAVVGNLSVSGIVQNALLGAVTQSLITQNVSQNGVNLLISSQTASQGLVNNLTQAVTSSLINIVGGIQSYTASLKSAAIVSSSQQIQNYNLFAVTSSGNTFYGNQQITGSLSIAAGQFDVITGSGELTSSLSFTHTTIDPITGNATLALRYRNNDVGPENNAWRFVADDGGVKLSYDQYATSNKLLFSVSSLGSNFDKLLIWRDARLFGKGLTVDDSLLVKGVITGSILATNGVVSSSNQLFELNNQTGSQGSINSVIGIVTASLNAYTASGATSTSNINSFTASQLAVNDLTLAVTSSLITQNTSQGLVNNLTQAVTSSLITQNTSQGLVNNLTQAVTSSLITIVGGLQSYTASLKNVGIVSSSNQLLELNNQTGSQNLINSGIATVTGSITNMLTLLNITSASLNDYSQSLKGAAIVSSSQQITNYYKFAETASANTFYGDQTITGSLAINDSATNFLIEGNGFSQTYLTSNGAIVLNPGYGGVEMVGSYRTFKATDITADGFVSGEIRATNNVVSSSQQIQNYNLFATTGSNVFIGNQTITGSLNVTGSITINSGSITMPNRPAFRVVGTGGQVYAQSVLSGSIVTVDYNQGNHYNPTNGLFTAPIAGLYQVNAVVRTNTNTNSTINQLIVYKSGSNTAGDVSQIMVEFGLNTSMNHTGGSTISKLEVGDTLRAVIAVGTCSFDGNDNFSVAYIG